MPQLLLPELVDKQPDWIPENMKAVPFGLRVRDANMTAEEMATPITLVVQNKWDDLPDLSRSYDFPYLVSSKFRELIERLDPENHYYVPVRILFKDGRVQEGTHFFFKMGKMVQMAIDTDQSDIAARIMSGEFVRYVIRKISPKIMWKYSKVKGRHIWMDEYLSNHLTVSDDFFAEIRRLDLSGYVSKESRIDLNQ